MPVFRYGKKADPDTPRYVGGGDSGHSKVAIWQIESGVLFWIGCGWENTSIFSGSCCVSFDSWELFPYNIAAIVKMPQRAQ